MTAKNACPHCGSHNHRMLADQMGRIGWCRDCHRTWEPSPSRKAIPTGVVGEVLSLHDPQHGHT